MGGKGKLITVILVYREKVLRVLNCPNKAGKIDENLLFIRPALWLVLWYVSDIAKTQ